MVFVREQVHDQRTEVRNESVEELKICKAPRMTSVASRRVAAPYGVANLRSSVKCSNPSHLQLYQRWRGQKSKLLFR